MLLDHFHPPLTLHHKWTSFYHMWACQIAAALNSILPDRWYAAPHVQFSVEIDDVVFDSQQHGTLSQVETGDEPWTLAADWTVPAPTAVLDFAMSSDAVGVQVFSTSEGPIVAGVIELVSPANKDRPESRDAFVSKCETYLQDGIGLVIADIVAGAPTSLHYQLMSRLGTNYASDLGSAMYAVSYRPAGPKENPHLQLWESPLQFGESLGEIPFPLKRGPCLKLDLNETYIRTCSALKLPAVA
jgi:hypothetical protein